MTGRGYRCIQAVRLASHGKLNRGVAFPAPLFIEAFGFVANNNRDVASQIGLEEISCVIQSSSEHVELVFAEPVLNLIR